VGGAAPARAARRCRRRGGAGGAAVPAARAAQRPGHDENPRPARHAPASPSGGTARDRGFRAAKLRGL